MSYILVTDNKLITSLRGTVSNEYENVMEFHRVSDAVRAAKTVLKNAMHIDKIEVLEDYGYECEQVYTVVER